LKELILELRRPLSVPTVAELISPDALAGKSPDEIATLRLWEGNRQVNLGEIFTIKGETGSSASELSVAVCGDVRKARRLGYRMKSGLLKIEGDAGMYVGEEMSGGSIYVEGNAGSWLGSKMAGGRIEVYGNAGNHVGAAYRGSRDGMKGGEIVIHGNAGVEAGCWMRDGAIRIKRNAGMFPGIHMCGGTVLIEGDCEGRAGANMTGGRIVIRGRIENILPSFTIEEIRDRVRVGDERIEGPFYVFQGDVGGPSTGRVFCSVTRNPQLKWCEKYLERW
jgi:formylmethanofuran dehydrogenase subunit C